MFIIAVAGQWVFLVCVSTEEIGLKKNALILMPAPLLNLQVAAITDISYPSSKYEFVGLFGSCSFCVHVILSGIHMQKTFILLLFLIYKCLSFRYC